MSETSWIISCNRIHLTAYVRSPFLVLKLTVHINDTCVGSVSRHFRFLFLMCMSVFAYMHVCAPHVCLVPEEVRRNRIPWNWSHTDGCEPLQGYWKPNQSPLIEQSALNHEPSAQHPPLSFFFFLQSVWLL